MCFFCRCNNMTTAIKGFTIHRSANVLTLALKRFDFLGAKISKVSWCFTNNKEIAKGPLTQFSACINVILIGMFLVNRM